MRGAIFAEGSLHARLCQRVDRKFTLKPMDVEQSAKLEARGVAATAKLKSEVDERRRYQSANAIAVNPSATNNSFLAKLFNN